MVFQELVTEIDENNYNSFLNNNFSVLNFFSDWHIDCLMVLPILEELAEEFKGRISFGKVNIEEVDGIAKKHNISQIPSLIVFKNGRVVVKIEDDVSEELIREKICCLL